SPRLDEFPVLGILHDPVADEMTVGDEDVAIGRRHDAGRRAEMVIVVAADAGLAERHQHLSVRAELAHDVPGLHTGLGGLGYSRIGGRVGDPDIALVIDMHAVRPDEHAGAEAFDHFAVAVELVDGVVRPDGAVAILAVDAEAAAPRHRHRARLVAADEDPD